MAPTGWPAPIRPPLGLIGCLPSISSQPSSTAFQLSPGAVMPKWSIAMYSEVVKQSWVSIASMPDTSAMPARFIASVIVLRTCGST